ncbi:MAG: hypothetical protein ACRC1K_14700 [Planctomycetia bacterium]
MLRKLVSSLVVSAVVVGYATPATAFFKKKCKVECAAPAAEECAGEMAADCGPAMTLTYVDEERTVMEPVMTTQKKKVTVVEHKPVVEDRKVTVHTLVAETKDVPYTYTVMVPKTMSKTETYHECVTSVVEEPRTHTVMVPHTETRTGVKKVCTMVPTVVHETKCVDVGGCYQEQVVTKKFLCWEKCKTECVYVPKMVEQVCEKTVMQPSYADVPYTYNVTVCKPETKTTMVKVHKSMMVPKTREVMYTQCVAEMKTGVNKVTTHKSVPVEKIEKVTVMKSFSVEKEIDVQVCTMVAKKVMVKVAHYVPAAPACGDAGSAGGCGEAAAGCGGASAGCGDAAPACGGCN